MNQLIAGGAAFVLVLVLWGLGRRPSKTILSSTDAGMVAAINRAQLGLVDSGLDNGGPSPEKRHAGTMPPFKSDLNRFQALIRMTLVEGIP